MQYEGPFRPGHGLSNWEVPREHKEMPDKRVGKTQIVATDRGHLIPGKRMHTCTPREAEEAIWEQK